MPAAQECPKSEGALEDALSAPPPAVVETMRRLEGDILVLGVAGKMGPSLARMALRASEMAGKKRRVIGAARFREGGAEVQLQSWGVETRRADLLNPEELRRLPDVPNILYLPAMKFGATGNEPATWAMNAALPAMVCQRFPKSRIVAFSTGNVYGLVPAASGGSRESDAPNPAGEYAMSCLGRERIFQHYAMANRQPVALIRLNYACDLRYGVLVDLAKAILADEPVNVAMSWFNTIWQGDANAHTLQAFNHADSPARIFNVTGARQLRVREVCARLGERLGRVPRLIGGETSDALLSNAELAHRLLGAPRIGEDQLIDWVADWLGRGGRTLGKATKFESRDGKF